MTPHTRETLEKWREAEKKEKEKPKMEKKNPVLARRDLREAWLKWQPKFLATRGETYYKGDQQTEKDSIHSLASEEFNDALRTFFEIE